MSVSGTTQNINALYIEGENICTTLNSLKARQDALSSAVGNYQDDTFNAEISDARADAFGNTHSNAGNNIRANQLYLYNLIIEKFSVLQNEYDQLALSVIKLADLINNLKGDASSS